MDHEDVAKRKITLRTHTEQRKQSKKHGTYGWDVG